MYLSWNEQILTDFCDVVVDTQYTDGYVFTRKDTGVMQQTRSMRVRLADFDLSSENRRILRKTEYLHLTVQPLPYAAYNWSIGKLAKDFYDTKFGEGTFSANKVKELLCEEASNFNRLLIYSREAQAASHKPLGYCIAHETESLLHYSYPFYDLNADKNTGMGMMLRAIVWAKKQGKTYCYLGSAQRPSDTYKLQFDGIEWFDGEIWQTDTDRLKELLKE